MQLVDIILSAIIVGFGAFGFWFGFVHTLGSVFGMILGIYLASRYYEPLAGWLVKVTGWEGNVPTVIAFIVAFVVINRLVGFAFWIFDKISSIITRLPFLNSLNHIFGLLLGLAEGVITLGIILFFIEKFPLSAPLMARLTDSIIAPYLMQVASILWPLIPDALKILHTTVDTVEQKVQP